MSRAKFTSNARAVYLYASRTIENNLDYRISITAKRIEFLLDLIDRESLNIKKVSLFLFCVFYKRRYHNENRNMEIFI